VIYGYAIAEPATAVPPPSRRGLGGAALRAIARADRAAVYSRHRSLRPRPSRDMLVAHELVVEALMARGAVLPLRFGTTLPSEEELAESLASRSDELVCALERVRGRVELGVRVVPARMPDGGTSGGGRRSSGRAYLLERVERHRRSEAVVRKLHEALDAVAQASRTRARPTPPAILIADYLVDCEDVEGFRSRVEGVAAAHDDLRVAVTGPWPPYNFTDGGEVP
jgi:hypothetical protein